MRLGAARRRRRRRRLRRPTRGGCSAPKTPAGSRGGALILRQNEIEKGDGGDADWAIPVSPPPGGTLESITITAAACGAPEASIWSLGWISPPANWPGSELRGGRALLSPRQRIQGVLHRPQVRQLEPRRKASATPGPGSSATTSRPRSSTPRRRRSASRTGRCSAKASSEVARASASSAEDVGGGLSSISVCVNGLPRRAAQGLQLRRRHGAQPERDRNRRRPDHPVPDQRRSELDDRHRLLSVPRRRQQRPRLRLGLRDAQRSEHDLLGAADGRASTTPARNRRSPAAKC